MIDRILASLRALVESFLARLPLAFVWRYSVVEVTETAFSGRALSALCPFADMPNIPLMPGIAGAGIKPAVGSIAGVAFLDGDPSKPFVVCWDQTVPVSVTVDASEKLRVAPSTTAVEIGETATTIKIAGNGQPAVHRVNDIGTAGTIELVGAPGAGTGFKWNAPDGTFVSFSFTFAAGAVVVAGADQNGPLLPAVGHPLPTKATTGSAKVSCG